MIISLKRTAGTTLLGLGMLVAGGGRAEAGLVLSAEAAGVQASQVAGVTTETFDSAPAGKYSNVNAASAVGTFTSPGIAVVAANLFGGAGNAGNYFAIGAESGTTTATLTFGSSQAYFGFWWSAADSLNGVDLYSKGQEVATLNTANVLAALGSAYNGNPNGTGDAGEKFAYLNFTGTNGTTIDQVVFHNASTATGFEADNFSIHAAPVAVSGTAIANGLATVPEPSSLVLASIGGLLGVGTWCRRRRDAVAG